MSAAALLERIELEEERRALWDSLAEESSALSTDFSLFVRRGWPQVWPHVPYVHGWHIDAMCHYLEATSAGEIRRLQIWVPPGSSKSTIASIMWPAWEWTRRPELRYITGSYNDRLATEHAMAARTLIQSPWYRQRWGDKVRMRADHNLKMSYANDAGGRREITTPGMSATGRHADRILVDDPLAADKIPTDADLTAANEWHDGLGTRWADPKTGVEVIIMQRVHERDVAGHAMTLEDWDVLCLPERYEAAHPFVCPDDVRTEEGALLSPGRVGEAENENRARRLGSHRAAGQLQQRPAAREGEILKRHLWQYFDPRLLDDPVPGSTDPSWKQLPAFRSVVSSWDTTFKATTTSDFVVGTLWGVDGGRRYLLQRRRGKMTLSQAKQAMREMRQWGLDRWAHAAHRVLVENTANGPDIVKQLKDEIPGVIPTQPSVSADQPSVKKTIRAEACEPDFESGSVLVPGFAKPGGMDYDPARTPVETQELIEEAASFPNGDYDDQVDSMTQGLNWIRSANVKPGSSAVSRRPIRSAAS